MENVNRLITNNEIRSVIKTLPGPNGFTGELYQTFKEELGGNTPKLILQGRHYPNTKGR